MDILTLGKSIKKEMNKAKRDRKRAETEWDSEEVSFYDGKVQAYAFVLLNLEHTDNYCNKYHNEALPDENNNCSQCGHTLKV